MLSLTDRFNRSDMFEHLASNRRIWYAISLVVLIPGLVALIIWGLNLGIDFTGGTLWEIEFTEPVSSEAISGILAENGYNDSVVQISSDNGLTDNIAIIRIDELSQLSPTKAAIESELKAQYGDFTQLQFSTVGGSVGKEVTRRAIYSVMAASVGIMLYMAFAFRNTQNPFLYGTCALIAMLHDVFVVLGIFAILGHFFDVEVDALFVTAILTVVGFSVHDTIVVFDRIRENQAKFPSDNFENTVNYSLAQTIVRSLNTSLTVVFTLLALYWFGGESTQTFVLALLIGVVSGTYSSIFNASQLLVSWEVGDLGRTIRGWLGREPKTAGAT